MPPRDVARVLAAGRSVAPVGRALGVREVLLGGMLLHAVDRPQVGVRWLRMLAAAQMQPAGASSTG